jgi:Protein of unknown function (DUF2946)
MRRRPFHLALLIFQALWLNVIVPGHQRGIVQLPNLHASASTACDSGCPFCACNQGNPAKSKSPTNRSENCAICSFAAYLSVPPTIDLTPPPLRFLHRVTPQTASDLIAHIVLVPFDGRAPPVV